MHRLNLKNIVSTMILSVFIFSTSLHTTYASEHSAAKKAKIIKNLAKPKEVLPLHVEISGEEFNELFEGDHFIKFINKNKKHYNYKYKQGLNDISDNKIVNTEYVETPCCFCLPWKRFVIRNQYSKRGEQFKPSGECHEGGLFFTHILNAHEFADSGDTLAIIEVPKDARVWLEEDKFKADKIDVDFLSGVELQDIEELSEDLVKKIEF
ncbi:MAG: hypothetical protein AB8G05_04885 [Oligoflexales bacterium]